MCVVDRAHEKAEIHTDKRCVEGMVCRLSSTLQFWAVWRVNISTAPLERTVE